MPKTDNAAITLWSKDLLAKLAEDPEPLEATGARTILWAVAARKGGFLTKDPTRLCAILRIEMTVWLRIAPKIAVVCVCLLLPCDTERLAREARRDDIHHSSKRAPVEGSNVVPYRKRRDVPFVLPLEQDGSGVLVELDTCDGSDSCEVASENAAANSAEQAQLIHCLPRSPMPESPHVAEDPRSPRLPRRT